MMCSANSVIIMSVAEVFIHSVEYSKLCNAICPAGAGHIASAALQATELVRNYE